MAVTLIIITTGTGEYYGMKQLGANGQSRQTS